MSYPLRESLFALKFIRLLYTQQVAASLGPDVLALMTFVAIKEDSLRYRPAPIFNEEIQRALGMAKWERLDRARTAAVNAGWLHYDRSASGSRTAGIYWVLDPTRNDDPQRDMNKEAYPAKGYAQGYAQGDETPKAYPAEGYQGGELSSLVLREPIESRAHELSKSNGRRVSGKRSNRLPDFSRLDLGHPSGILHAKQLLESTGNPIDLHRIVVAAAIAVRKGDNPPALFTKLLRDGWGKYSPSETDELAAKEMIRRLHDED